MKRFLLRRRTALLSAAVLVIAAFFCLWIGRVSSERAARLLPLGILIALCIGGAALLIISAAGRGETVCKGKTFFFALLLSGLAFTLALPPFLSPDEKTHYATAYRYANMALGAEGAADGVLSSSIGLAECRVTFRAEDAAALERLGDATADYASIWAPILRDFQWKSAEASPLALQCTTAPYAATGYLFSAAGLALGRLLDLGAIPCLFLARIANLLFAAALIALAARRIPILSRLLAVTALLPMTISLIASLSPDAMLIPLGFYAFSELTRLSLLERKLNARDLALSALLFALLCPLKIHCAPLALSLLALTPKRFLSKAQYVLGVIGSIAVTALACLLVNANAFANVLSGSGTYVAEGYSLSFLLTQPIEALSIIARTFAVQLPTLALCLAGHLLGNLNVALPSYFYTLLYLLLLVFAALRTPGERTLSPGSRRLFFLLSALTVLASYAVMLVWWTDAGSPLITGVQGRYFLPAIPFALTVLHGEKPVVFESAGFVLISAALLNVISALYCYVSVIAA